jgi:hypothetical protein
MRKTILGLNIKETTPDAISELKPNEIFVFGSNLAGRHGGGAARLAYEKFGAMMGVGIGPTGKCYAIPTKDMSIETMELHDIEPHIKTFLQYAAAHPKKKFYVTQIGCGLAGLTPAQMAPMFFKYKSTPNVIYPQVFLDLLK